MSTTHGPVRGAALDGLQVFKGVRYGAPPTGEHRFKPPCPPEPWREVADCLALGAPAIQHGRPPGEAVRGVIEANLGIDEVNPDEPGTTEDCLFLNVWTPRVDRGRRPVMVWLHGGGYANGSGGETWYDGAALARRGDVVVVTVNHRLNAFGYLQLSDLFGPEYAHSGQAGILDIIQALTWVRENITEFGGDPGNVTIFGESGGGAKVAMLMSLPAASGLYHKAIIQSAGHAHRAMTREDALTATRTFLSNAGVEPGDTAGLKALSADAVSRAAGGVPGDPMKEFAPCLDGDTVTRHPFEPDAPSESAQVPLLIGRTKDETLAFMHFHPQFGALEDADVAAHAQLEFGERSDEAEAAVRAAYPNYSPTDLLAALWTSTYIWGPALIIASRKAEQSAAPVWMYQLTWETPIGGLRSPHGIDVPLVFDNVDSARSLVGPGDAPQRMADLLCDSWLAFVRTGNPETPSLPAWPPYDTTRRATMFLDLESRIVDDLNVGLRRLLPT
ncbi:MAG: carboxylesterase family protein [Ilumatobacteraceae bacterium]